MNKVMYKNLLESQEKVNRELTAMNRKYEEEPKGIRYHLKKPFAVMGNMSLFAWVVVGVMAGLFMLVI